MVSLQPLGKQSNIFWPVRPYMIWIFFAFSVEFIISHLPPLIDYALATLIFFLFLSSLWDTVKKSVPVSHLSLYSYPSVPLPHWLTCPNDLFWPLRQEQIWYKRRLDKHYTLRTFFPWMLVEEAWITLLFHEWHTAQFPSLFLLTSIQPLDMQWAQHMSEFRGHGIRCYSWAQPKLLSFVTNADVV